MNKQTKTIKVDGVPVRVMIRHADTETAWVYLHGWGSRKGVWQPIVTDLDQTQVFVDLPGFGESGDLLEPWDITDYTEAIERLVENLDYNSAVLVGHSFGGQIAAAIAANQPAWLTGLVLVDAAVIRDSQPKLLSAAGAWLSSLLSTLGISFLKNTLYKWINADRPPSDPNLKKTMRNVLRSDQTDVLSDITVPTQVIWGRHDTVTPLSYGEEITQQIPKASLSVLDGTHYIFLDVPERFTQEITDFQKTLSS